MFWAELALRLPLDGIRRMFFPRHRPVASHSSFRAERHFYRGAGIPNAQAALFDLGRFHIWVFSPDDKCAYYLWGAIFC
jgi:hypothetical protein